MRDRALRPHPRSSRGSGAAAGIRCAIDVSDGLVQDLGHVCEAAGVGAAVRLAELPVSEDLAQRSRRRRGAGGDGGEDYELLLTGRRRSSRVAGACDAVTVVGEMVEARSAVRFLDERGTS